MRNVELKARLTGGLEAARRVAQSIGAELRYRDRQIDTYFRVPSGRLKTRESSAREGELIAYRRADEAGSRLSDYVILRGDAAPMRAFLADALGVAAVVDKEREVWIWKNVRIHLDVVAGLGTFLEFEAVLGEGEDEATNHARVAELCRRFGIGDGDLVTTSYGEMVRSR
jgi:adenylate cyclase, class 2